MRLFNIFNMLFWLFLFVVVCSQISIVSLLPPLWHFQYFVVVVVCCSYCLSSPSSSPLLGLFKLQGRTNSSEEMEITWSLYHDQDPSSLILPNWAFIIFFSFTWSFIKVHSVSFFQIVPSSIFFKLAWSVIKIHPVSFFLIEPSSFSFLWADKNRRAKNNSHFSPVR